MIPPKLLGSPRGGHNGHFIGGLGSPKMQTKRMVVNLYGRIVDVKLHNDFLIPPEQAFNIVHFIPSRAAIIEANRYVIPAKPSEAMQCRAKTPRLKTKATLFSLTGPEQRPLSIIEFGAVLTIGGR